MKLINKLLPIAAIGATAAVVTPLATSCGNGLNNFNGETIFIPTIVPAEPDEEKIRRDGGYTAEEATDIYFADLAKNPEIFVQDMYYVLSTGMFRAKNSTPAARDMIRTNLGIKYSNLEVNKTKLTLSYEVELQADLFIISGTSTRTTVSLYADGLKLHAWFKNIPYICSQIIGYVESVPYWVAWDVQANLGQSSLETASIRFIGNGTIVSQGDFRWHFLGKDITIDKNYDKLSYEEKLEADAAEMIFGQMLGRTGEAGSYHLTKLFGKLQS